MSQVLVIDPLAYVDSYIEVSGEFDSRGDIINMKVLLTGSNIFGFSGEFVKLAETSSPWYSLNGNILCIADEEFELQQFFGSPYNMWIGKLTS